jgi:hypothetical protein
MRALPRVAAFAYSLSKLTVAQKPDATKRPERGFSDGPFAFGGGRFLAAFSVRAVARMRTPPNDRCEA